MTTGAIVSLNERNGVKGEKNYGILGQIDRGRAGV